MDQVSLTIPLRPTMSSSFTSTPLLSSSGTPLPPSSISLPQHLVMSDIMKDNAGAGAKPPRPPNSWILYRSDKIQELPPTPLGQPKPTQAQVSKIISAQWRTESDEVRAMYEQRAETAKAEHARLYPDYRFAPQKKADKDRIREEKRQAKEQERASRRVRARVTPYPLPSTASPFQTSSPLRIKHMVPNAKFASRSISSSTSSLLSTVPNSQPCVNVSPYDGSTRVSSDASINPQFQSIHSQNPSFNESLRLGAAAPSASSSSTVPHDLTFSIPQPPPPKGWSPSPSEELSPLPDIPLSELPQSTPPTEDPPQEACVIPTSFLSGINNVLIRFAHFTLPCLA
jgi:HMG (high mobility group) box protein